MSQSVTEAFDKLSTVSQKLNTASDQMGTAVRHFEDMLGSLNMGVSAWVVFNESSTTRNSFGYSKINGKWGLAIKVETLATTSFEDVAFNDAPRWQRIAALAHLLLLLAKLTSNAEQMIEDVSAREIQISAFVAAVNRSKSLTKAGA